MTEVTAQECLEAVNALIKPGELPAHAHEERNGLILAANTILKLINRETQLSEKPN